MQHRSVLVVEDDAVLASLVEEGLTQMGYDTHVANNLATGFNFVEDQLPELLILDLGLPDGRGWTLLEGIRTRYPESEHPVVLVMSSDVSRSELRENGIGHFLAKPFAVRYLCEMVAELLPMCNDDPTPCQ